MSTRPPTIFLRNVTSPYYLETVNASFAGTQGLLVDEPMPYYPSLAILILSGLVYSSGFFSLLYAIHHRFYPPLKAKHVPLLGTAFIGCFLWFMGELHSNGILGYNHWLTRMCSVWDVWIQFVFGIELLICVLVIRLYSLYCVFVKGKAISDVRLLWPVVVFYIPALAVGLFSLLGPPAYTTSYDSLHGYCSMHIYTKVSMFAIGAFGLLILGWFTWSLRNIRKGFNEFKELRLGFYVALVTLLVNTVILLSAMNYKLWGKYLIVAVNLISGNMYLWLVISKPLYGCMFHREECLRQFITDLNLEGYNGSSLQQDTSRKTSKSPLMSGTQSAFKIGSPRMRITGYQYAQTAGGKLFPIAHPDRELEGFDEPEMRIQLPRSVVRKPSLPFAELEEEERLRREGEQRVW